MYSCQYFFAKTRYKCLNGYRNDKNKNPHGFAKSYRGIFVWVWITKQAPRITAKQNVLFGKSKVPQAPRLWAKFLEPAIKIDTCISVGSKENAHPPT